MDKKEREKYLEGLEKEHREIRRFFTDLSPVMEKGDVGDILEMKKRLERLKSILIEHVRSEDDIFYVELRKKAVQMKQEALLPALDLFMDSMHGVSHEAERFFREFENEKHILDDVGAFSGSLKKLRDDIIKRIESEEGSLFYIYKAYFVD